MGTIKHEILFSPFDLGQLHLRNRIVMAPMTRMACENHIPTQKDASYYRQFAEGGASLLITECTFINHPAANAYPGAPAFYGDQVLEGWGKVVDEVHSAGSYIIPQIWHAGPMRPSGTSPNVEIPAYGPMEASVDGVVETIGMSKQDIDEVIRAFAKAAADAKAVGFDGVEIHGAHSFLIDQFLWDETNQREDDYGGSIQNRVRFAVKIVSAVREAVGNEFPVIFRFSQWKQGNYDAHIANNPEELEQILLPLVYAGVDAFHPSTRRFWEPAFDTTVLSLPALTKKITGKPVIAVGSVGIDIPLDLSIFNGEAFESHPASIEALDIALASGDFDLVAVGRALLGDPKWPEKIKHDRYDQIASFMPESLQRLTT